MTYKGNLSSYTYMLLYSKGSTNGVWECEIHDVCTGEKLPSARVIGSLTDEDLKRYVADIVRQWEFEKCKDNPVNALDWEDVHDLGGGVLYTRHGDRANISVSTVEKAEPTRYHITLVTSDEKLATDIAKGLIPLTK